MFQLSFWEKQSYFSGIDVLIAGSGIVGLNAAIALKQKNPRLHILIVDRGFLPYGASTRNAGFACFGSISELLDDLTHMSEQDVFGLLLKRWNGLKRLRSLLKDANMGYEGYGGYEVFSHNDNELFNKCIKALSFFNSHLKELTGYREVYKLSDDKIGAFGFNNVQHLICNEHEGQIDAGKMMKALAAKAREQGIDIVNGIEIEKFETENNHVKIFTKQNFSFDTMRLLITTNGFARQLIPNLEVIPARAQVLITAPIDNLKIKGTFHYDKGYYYFRNVGNRLLLGGGRNLDFEKERTDEFGLTEQVQKRLDEMMQQIILPGVRYSIEHRWSGIMGLGSSKTVIMQQVMPHVYCAVRMGGMGIAIGSLVGADAADMLLQNF